MALSANQEIIVDMLQQNGLEVLCTHDNVRARVWCEYLKNCQYWRQIDTVADAEKYINVAKAKKEDNHA